MMAGALVLAAGRGERMGGPKALLAWPHGADSVPLAWAHALARLAGHPEGEICDLVLIVTRLAVAEVLERHRPSGLDAARLVVSSEADELGPAGSIRAAASMLHQREAWIVTPVDCPPVEDAVVGRLLGALVPETLAVRPRYRGRGGHPVLVQRELLAGYLDSAVPLRQVLAANAHRVVDVEVDDPSVRSDMNTPAQLPAASAGPRFFD